MYSKILVALDGSDYGFAGGAVALALARKLGSHIVASHIYDARLHSKRLREMEPVLPVQYQREEALNEVREAHKSLIVEGFHALSKGYMEAFQKNAETMGVHVTQVHREGRNYMALLETAQDHDVDLIVLGAHGMGKAHDGLMGSTAVRILRLAPVDVLIVRQNPIQGKILVGIDGSEEALAAMQKGAFWAGAMGLTFYMASVYDPRFHNQVFKAMAASLPPETQAQVGLGKQENLHEELIDQGLGKLYQTFLDEARMECKKVDINAQLTLLQGKPYRALLDYADADVGLIVVGRFGHHRETRVEIGSNSEALARLSDTNVLVTQAVKSSEGKPREEPLMLEWDQEALARLQRIPPFVRPMAAKTIEDHVRSKGKSRVTTEDLEAMAHRLGMVNGGGVNS